MAEEPLFSSRLFQNRSPYQTAVLFIVLIILLVFSYYYAISTYKWILIAVCLLAGIALARVSWKNSPSPDHLEVWLNFSQQISTKLYEAGVIILINGNGSLAKFGGPDPGSSSSLILAKKNIVSIKSISAGTIIPKSKETFSQFYYSNRQGGFEFLINEIEVVRFLKPETLKDQKIFISVEQKDKMYDVLKEQGFPIEK